MARVLAVVLGLSAASLPSPARAQDAPAATIRVGRSRPARRLPPVRWHAQWRRFDAWDWVLTGSAVPVIVAASVVGPGSSPWRGGILFDEGVRDVLRAPTEHSRRFFRDASDVLLTFTTSYPIFVDALGAAAWYHDDRDLATQMILMDAEVVLVTAAVQRAVNALAGRERPYGRGCGTDLPNKSNDCDSNNRFYSFFSGHTAQTFAAAALTCNQHAHLPLYGGGAADLAPCLAGLGLAATTGLLRIVGDQHYATDVLTGAVVGTTTGLLLPILLHYGFGSSEEPPGDEAGAAAERADVLTFHLLPTVTGLQAVGTF